MLERTRHIWKRRIQGRLFDAAGMQALLDERERNTLEDHMGFRGQFPEHRRFQIDELKKLGLRPSNSVLEIGCGPLTAGIPVIQFLDANGYCGVDIRSSVLDLAWQQIGKHGLSSKNPRLVCSTSFGRDELGSRKFDFVWAFSVLYHLSDEILEQLFQAVAMNIDDGMFVANVQTNMDNSTWLQFPFLKRSVDDYRKVAERHGFVTEDLGTLDDRGFKLDGEENANPLLKFTLAK